jgi:hypothetical protein
MRKPIRGQGEMKKVIEKLAQLKSRMPANVCGAHDHCSRHRKEILASERCACFYCGVLFAPGEITEWIDGEHTALCPKCGIDSVIGSAACIPLTKEFLEEMRKYWF